MSSVQSSLPAGIGWAIAWLSLVLVGWLGLKYGSECGTWRFQHCRTPVNYCSARHFPWKHIIMFMWLRVSSNYCWVIVNVAVVVVERHYTYRSVWLEFLRLQCVRVVFLFIFIFFFRFHDIIVPSWPCSALRTGFFRRKMRGDCISGMIFVDKSALPPKKKPGRISTLRILRFLVLRQEPNRGFGDALLAQQCANRIYTINSVASCHTAFVVVVVYVKILILHIMWLADGYVPSQVYGSVVGKWIFRRVNSSDFIHFWFARIYIASRVQCSALTAHRQDSGVHQRWATEMIATATATEDDSDSVFGGNIGRDGVAASGEQSQVYAAPLSFAISTISARLPLHSSKLLLLLWIT